MGRSKSKAIVYLIISAVVIILIKLWLHYTSWLPIATIRAEEQARAVASSACPRQKSINFIKVL